MSIYLKNFGCPDNFTNDWKKLHATKWILLCAGLAMAVIGYYIGCSLIILDGGQQMWITCALFWGTAGVFIAAYSIALILLRKKLYNVHRSLKYEDKLNAFRGSHFYNEDDGIYVQRDKQISVSMPTHCFKRRLFSWGLNKDVTFKEKYIGCNGAAKGMNGSYETVYKGDILNTCKGMERKLSNKLSENLSYKKEYDMFYQHTKSSDAFVNETFGSQKLSSSLEESSFANFIKWEDHTSKLQNDIGFKDISNDAQFVFKHEPETGVNGNIHVSDKDIERNNFQLSPSSFKCELFEDPYLCKSLCEHDTMELAVETLVTREQLKRSETEMFAFEFASFAAEIALRSDIQQSYDKILKVEKPKTVTDGVKVSDNQFWLKIPMKRNNSKLTKKRCEPIIFNNPDIVSKNEPYIHQWEKSSSTFVSASSGN